MYLAEDRILCLEIVVKKGNRYRYRYHCECNSPHPQVVPSIDDVSRCCAAHECHQHVAFSTGSGRNAVATTATHRLEYVKEAVAEADPVTKLTDLLKQRRRWLNGTFFALIYTLSNWLRVWTDSHHNFVRKVVISFEFMYLTVLTVLGTWFGIGILYTIFYNLAMSTFNSSYAVQQVLMRAFDLQHVFCCSPLFSLCVHGLLAHRSASWWWLAISFCSSSKW